MHSRTYSKLSTKRIVAAQPARALYALASNHVVRLHQSGSVCDQFGKGRNLLASSTLCFATDLMHDPPDDIQDPNIRLVSLSQQDLEDANRLLRLLTVHADLDRLGPRGMDAGDEAGQRLARAQQILAHRRRRVELFGKELFGEPAWEMLLLLYVARTTQRYTVGQLAQASGAPKSSGARWIDHLEQQGLVEKDQHPTDRRTAFVRLSQKGQDELSLYLSETLATG